MSLMFQCPWIIKSPIVIRSMESPIRFIRTVIIPALSDFFL